MGYKLNTNKCPVCGKSSKCKYDSTNDMVACLEGWTEDVDGYKYCYESGAFQIFRPDHQAKGFRPTIPSVTAKKAIIPNTKRDKQSRALLNQLGLTSKDREILLGRGLTEETIDTVGFKSISSGQILDSRIPGHYPGVYDTSDGRHQFMDMGGFPGILLPIKNSFGQIISFQVMLTGDREAIKASKQPKYKNLGKVNNNDGEIISFRNELNEPPVVVIDKQTKTVFITEGILKPYITADKWDCSVIGYPGSYWASSPQTFALELENLSKNLPTNTNGKEKVKVVICPDAGYMTKGKDKKGKPTVISNVYRGIYGLVKMVVELGYDCEVASWGQEHNKEVGDIDEISPDTPLTYTSGLKFLSTAEKKIITREDIELLAHHNVYGVEDKDGDVIEAPLNVVVYDRDSLLDEYPGNTVIRFSQNLREEMYRELLNKGYETIIDTSPTGSGKSHTIGLIEPDNFDKEYLVVLVSKPQKTTTETMRENLTIVTVRHNGLVEDEEGGYRRYVEGKDNPEDIVIPSNCWATHLHNALYQQSKTTTLVKLDGSIKRSSVCQKCPVRLRCYGEKLDFYINSNIPNPILEKEYDYDLAHGYWEQKEKEKDDKKLVMHVNSLLTAGVTPNKTLLIIDEPSHAIAPAKEINLTVRDINMFRLRIHRLIPDQQEEVEKVYEYLSNLLSFLHSQPTKQYPNGVPDSNIRELLVDMPYLDLEPLIEYNINVLWHAKVDEVLSGEVIYKLYPTWLYDLVDILQGKKNGSLSVYHDEEDGFDYLQVLCQGYKSLDALQLFPHRIILDATGSKKDIDRLIPDESTRKYIRVESIAPMPNNLNIIQIKQPNNLGNGRNLDSCKLIQQFIDEFCLLYGYKSKEVGIIDWKSKTYIEGYDKLNHLCSGSDGAIGSNKFQTKRIVFSIGEPRKHLGHLSALYQVFTGNYHPPRSKAIGYRKFIQDNLENAYIQELGRLRANRRPDDDCVFVAITRPQTDLSFFANYGSLQVKWMYQITPEICSRLEQQTLEMVLAYKNAKKAINGEIPKAEDLLPYLTCKVTKSALYKRQFINSKGYSTYGWDKFVAYCEGMEYDFLQQYLQAGHNKYNLLLSILKEEGDKPECEWFVRQTLLNIIPEIEDLLALSPNPDRVEELFSLMEDLADALEVTILENNLEDRISNYLKRKRYHKLLPYMEESLEINKLVNRLTNIGTLETITG